MKVITSRNPQGKMRCITLSDDAFEWIKQFSKENGKSVSLMLEMLIRSRMLGKNISNLIDYDLFKSDK